MDLKLTNKLALVTGSTAGIGYAIAEALAREGSRVIVNGRTQDAVDAAAAEIKIEQRRRCPRIHCGAGGRAGTAVPGRHAANASDDSPDEAAK